MASSLTRNQLDSVSLANYNEVRSILKTGDILFCSGDYLFSRIIQRLTKSTWSHTAIIYKDETLGRVLVLEAEPSVGIRLIPLSKYLTDYNGTKKPYKGRIFDNKLKTELDKEHFSRGISFGLDELTRPYDGHEIIRIFFRIVFRMGKRQKNRAYTCSELVHSMYSKAGVDFKFHDSYISPDDIWKDERVDMKYRML
ncbi:MAG TPA: YiiX/YebB-like N1pC/P60 family cysteine hydrolase [Puia sp.]|nr:YiiX/YebB-like N1pC/P60 family cysteine hydrolase [Puia sp.]